MLLRISRCLLPVFLSFLVLSATTSIHAATLRAAWLFDGTFNGVGPDSQTGVLVDNDGVAPTFVPDAFGGQGLFFQGPDPDHVVFPGTMSSLELGTTDFSIVLVTRTNASDTAEDVRFLGTQDATGAGNGIQLFHNRTIDSLRFNQRTNTEFFQNDSTLDPADNVTHSWVVTRASDGMVEFYRDGVAAGPTSSPAFAPNLINDFDLFVSNDFDFDFSATELFIDDIGFFDGILTQAEATEISTIGLAAFIPEPSTGLMSLIGVLAFAATRRRSRIS